MVSPPSCPSSVLFGRTRQAVLSLFLTRPDESFYFRDVVRRTGCGVGPVQRELAQLAACGILSRDRDGYYQANSASPVHEPLKQLVVRTVGLASALRTALGHVAADVRAAFIFGSFARGEQRETSDVDVMVVVASDAAITLERLLPLFRDAPATTGREVNPFLLTAREFREKCRTRNPFLRRVLAGEKIFLIGDADDLERLAEERVGQTAPADAGGDRRPARRRRARPKGRKGQGTQR